MRLLLASQRRVFTPASSITSRYGSRLGARARAVSRFYIALPLSSTVMGALAGWLMGLNGKMGLRDGSGCSWSRGFHRCVQCGHLTPAARRSQRKATWLTGRKKLATSQLEVDGKEAHLGHEAGVLKRAAFTQGLDDWPLLLELSCSYAYSFSAPSIYQRSPDGASECRISGGMHRASGSGRHATDGSHSDRTGERQMHCIVPCLIIGFGYVIASYSRLPWVVVARAGHCFIAHSALQGPALRFPSVSRWARRRHRHRGHEHHHHVQRIFGPIGWVS